MRPLILVKMKGVPTAGAAGINAVLTDEAEPALAPPITAVKPVTSANENTWPGTRLCALALVVSVVLEAGAVMAVVWLAPVVE